MKILLTLIIISHNAFATDELAIKKIKEFGKILKKELKAGLKKSPEKAVEICNLRAPEIQKQVSSEGVLIGRVSLKNRNPKNKPKDWMKDYINQFHANEIKKAYVTAKLENGKTGLLKPIRTMPMCLKCHGSNIDEGLYKTIKSKYPNDKAIGYKAGDIRGFFWAEY
ncbi:hypothetical protein BIY24_02350 [Halobacteriovorax marinus]|uniref:Tll0287-like domain-containing protein n=1 Tax=Halobacteriovorax marinus TaxID=97084 RepID=UPI000BC303E3|nr:DUF3365 domain-containing protein [Halobacteriovorax marinus]ATH06818.1 hypothetical protein BIY24_02350 [Halobacteriovorax marinus]